MTTETQEQSCSDCALGIQQIELGSIFGFLSEEAANFASATANCGATGYAYIVPTPLALDSTSTVTAPPSTKTCTPYTINGADDCNSVAQANNISTFALLYENNLEAYCANFPAVGKSVCLPEQCHV